jgi:hypothetical protein
VASFPCPAPGCKGRCFQPKNSVVLWRGQHVIVPTEMANSMILWSSRGRPVGLRPFPTEFPDYVVDDAMRVDQELGIQLRRARGPGPATAAHGVIITCDCGHGPFIVDLPETSAEP